MQEVRTYLGIRASREGIFRREKKSNKLSTVTQFMVENHGIELVPNRIYEPSLVFVIRKLDNPKLLILIEIIGWQLTQVMHLKAQLEEDGLTNLAVHWLDTSDWNPASPLQSFIQTFLDLPENNTKVNSCMAWRDREGDRLTILRQI